MIVFDASTLVGVAIREDGTPARALRHALQRDQVALSQPVLAELVDVLHRPRLARFLNLELRAALLSELARFGVSFSPTVRVTDCRDKKDNKYLELALAAQATILVSSDEDLLTLHPWRGVRILRAATYCAEADGRD